MLNQNEKIKHLGLRVEELWEIQWKTSWCKINVRKQKLDTLNCHQSQDGKKPRRAMEVMSLNTKIEQSETAIKKLRAHIKDGTCPKTLRYNVRANITPDEQFKKEIGSIRKTAEKEFIRSLAKFHHRRIEHLQSKRTKVEQELSRKKTETNAFQTRKSMTPAAPRDENIHMSTDVLKLASNIQREDRQVHAITVKDWWF